MKLRSPEPRTEYYFQRAGGKGNEENVIPRLREVMQGSEKSCVSYNSYAERDRSKERRIGKRLPSWGWRRIGEDGCSLPPRETVPKVRHSNTDTHSETSEEEA